MKTPQTPNFATNASTSRTSTPRTPNRPLPSSPPPKVRSILDANAPIFVPLSGPVTNDQEENHVDMKARILARFNGDGGSYFDADPSGDNPNSEYVRLKLKLDSLSGWRRAANETADDSFIKELRSRLEAVKRHYFFDEDDAEAQYRTERQKSDAAHLQARLRANEAPTLPVSSPPAKHRPAPLQPSPPELPSKPSSDVFEADGEDATVGLFDILEPLPTEETTSTGTTVTIRDMALPKHWSGRTPKTLLTEIVHKVPSAFMCPFSCILLTSTLRTLVDGPICCHHLPLHFWAESRQTCCCYDSLGRRQDRGLGNERVCMPRHEPSRAIYRHCRPAFPHLPSVGRVCLGDKFRECAHVLPLTSVDIQRTMGRTGSRSQIRRGRHQSGCLGKTQIYRRTEDGP